MVRSPKIDRWSSRSHIRERTLQDRRSHFNPQLQSMCMVRSPKSIAGAVGATLGNAPYKIGDRTRRSAIALSWILS
ncbi:hypothetical protein ACLB6K_14935 [Microcystis aeruginosa FACHB-524]|uniref:hypothetical protein n=1 Tax=Microcystis aeruginosa TaxID=1126 RepID=UPI0011CE72C4|nr:hypothetical protein [Microcystis aeruginosa]